ncbi:MAG: hypothetical protein KDA71_04515, partial [Planctomycetales bacterium]|nr:hypothetical protein [Planctomycetales bacterium]
DADNLQVDLGGTEAPHISQCITKHAMFRAVRFSSTIGLPASPTAFGAITLKRTGLNFERVDGAAKADAADNAESVAVNEDSVSTDLGLSGNVTTDQSYSVIPDGGQNVRLYAGKGGFRLQNNNGLGVAGVGADDQRLDNIDPSDDTNYPGIDEFPDPDEREKVIVEFDEKMSQFTATLRHFGETDNTAYYVTTSPLPRERVRLRAYDTTLDDNNELVAEETYDSCVANQGLGSNFANGSVISTNFGGVLFDKVEIIPEPFDTQAAPEDDSQETWSAFVVGQVRGCGPDETCGWDYSDVTGNVTFARSKCAELTFPASPANGGGITAEISPQSVETQLGTSYDNATSHNQAWLDLSGEAADTPPGLGVDIYASRGEIYIQDSTGGNAESQDGFAVGDTTVDISNATIDGGSDATTRESISVRFDEAWDRAVIGLSRFGENTNDTDPERALVQFFLAGTQVGPDYTFTPCTMNGTNQTQTQWRVDGTVTPGSQFDTVQVTAIQDALGADSTFRLRALRACDPVDAGCQLDYGDENDAQPTRYCAFTCDSSGTCTAH